MNGAASPQRAGPRGNILFLLFLLAFGLAATGLLLLGLPGFLWIELAAPLVGRPVRVEEGWAAALVLSVAWPWFVPLSYLVLAGVVGPGWRRWVSVLGATAVASTLLAVALRGVAW